MMSIYIWIILILSITMSIYSSSNPLQCLDIGGIPRDYYMLLRHPTFYEFTKEYKYSKMSSDDTELIKRTQEID